MRNYPSPKECCHGCGSHIIWAKTSSGHLVALDATPQENGNVVLDGSGTATVLKKDLFETVPEGTHYVSHFATCPKARKPSKKK